jgi:hypothetical protein
MIATIIMALLFFSMLSICLYGIVDIAKQLNQLKLHEKEYRNFMENNPDCEYSFEEWHEIYKQ